MFLDIENKHGWLSIRWKNNTQMTIKECTLQYHIILTMILKTYDASTSNEKSSKIGTKDKPVSTYLFTYFQFADNHFNKLFRTSFIRMLTMVMYLFTNHRWLFYYIYIVSHITTGIIYLFTCDHKSIPHLHSVHK